MDFFTKEPKEELHFTIGMIKTFLILAEQFALENYSTGAQSFGCSILGESVSDLDMVLLHYIAQGRRGTVIIDHSDGLATRRDHFQLHPGSET
jgi:hypothetical protein